ncbi:hypothetical protein CLV24_1312 [Pontibacter ummariensis]|uniref:Uncharacterized protein n=1 Tax=Pontibacter ummariensis TaxID=1610492 RepID=A0A239KRJ8_9BACT|nr:hypothetical protein CLV24_1312 [Pontibacter ummariensis]SNT20660.1 hypothetical protein SAMN06296052_1312 [Pontibacter ummariensis]
MNQDQENKDVSLLEAVALNNCVVLLLVWFVVLHEAQEHKLTLLNIRKVIRLIMCDEGTPAIKVSL